VRKNGPSIRGEEWKYSRKGYNKVGGKRRGKDSSLRRRRRIPEEGMGSGQRRRYLQERSLFPEAGI